MFDRADELGVDYLLDRDFSLDKASTLVQRLLDRVDFLYLTCCLDVFPAWVAPGVSAPAALGVEPLIILQVMEEIIKQCKKSNVMLLAADVAELSPQHDIDARTARLAALLVDEYVAMREAILD